MAPGPDELVQRDEDGNFTKETLKRAVKAFRRRLKLTRADDESRLGHDPTSKGEASSIVGIKPPEQYPKDVWEALVEKGRMRSLGDGVYELLDN